MSCVTVFGGSGFIGSFWADFVLENRLFSKVYLYDLEPPEEKSFPCRTRVLAKYGRLVEYVRGDVREPIAWRPEEPVGFIANFAAVHREPGHEDWEYFNTNLSAAEYVTAWAEEVGCVNIVFTSSTSLYGLSEDEKDEATLPVPAYFGRS